MGEIDPGLESREAVQTVGKFWRNRIFIGALFFFLLALIMILPFRHEHTGGSYSQLFGGMGYSEPSDKYTSGYQEPTVPVVSIFYFVTLGLFMLAKKRIVLIFSVIAAFLNLLSLPVIYFMLTFHLRFFGPPVTIKVSYGYYALVILDVLLVIMVFLLLREFPKGEERKSSEDLLDF